ncbi:hypothetical protein C9994_09250 [Marivirga lumbricoides]|uniref:Uncharacterized protein n=1 Tax=Marivirga lumbricoides TaxID=1046115 RepID=A0A2T4DQC7_9BACT|nr:hypothetical protein C9994_09250 [Marivirga lumbricoides]
MNLNKKLIILIFIVFSCGDRTIKYEYTIYRDGKIEFLREPFNEGSKEFIEKGDFVMDSPDGDTLMLGKYSNGFKVGRWEYFPNDSQTVNIDWTIYENEKSGISINYPSDWKLINSSQRPFQAVFSTESEIKEDKYFILSFYLKKSINMTLDEYWNLYNSRTHSNDSVKSYLLRKFSQDSSEYYLSTYTVNKNNEEVFIMNFLGESDGKIYDITYSSLKGEVEKKFIVFLDMIRSIRFNGIRFFSPFKETKIIELNWPSKPDRKS